MCSAVIVTVANFANNNKKCKKNSVNSTKNAGDGNNTGRANNVNIDNNNTGRANNVNIDNNNNTGRANNVNIDNNNTGRANNVNSDNNNTGRANNVNIDNNNTGRANNVSSDIINTDRGNNVNSDNNNKKKMVVLIHWRLLSLKKEPSLKKHHCSVSPKASPESHRRDSQQCRDGWRQGDGFSGRYSAFHRYIYLLWA